MNSVITDMYAKKAQPANMGSGSIEEVCPPVMTSGRVSFTIDRTGTRPSHVIFESDQEQLSANLSDSVTVHGAATAAGIHQQSAADDVILIEDSREDDEKLNTSTNTPLAAVSINKQSSAKEKVTVTHAQYILIIS